MAKFKVSKYGQWEYPGQPTAVPTEDGRITMQGVPYPVMGFVPGQPPVMMQPGGNYQFPGKMVYEIPMAYGGDISIPDLSRPNWLDKAQKGQQVKYYDDLKKFNEANEAWKDSSSGYNAYPIPDGVTGYKISTEEFLRDNNPAPGQLIHFHNIKNRDFANNLGINPARIEPVGDSRLGTEGFEWVYKKPTQQPKLDQQAVMQQISKNYPGYSIKFDKNKIFIRQPRTDDDVDNGIFPVWQPLPIQKKKSKPQEFIPTKTVKLEREPIELVMPQSDRMLDGYNNTMQVLRSIQQDDRDKQGPKVVPAPDFRYGGWLDKAQYGKATRADSLEVLNNTKQLEDYFKSYTFRESIPVEKNNDWINRLDDSRSKFNSITVRNTPQGTRSVTLDEYYKPVDKNKFYQMEMADATLDTRAPMSLFDRRIRPQEKLSVAYNNPKDSMHGNYTTIYKYDPLAITPFDMLSDADKKLRIQKYGVPSPSAPTIPPRPPVPKNIPYRNVQLLQQPEDRLVREYTTQEINPEYRRVYDKSPYSTKEYGPEGKPTHWAKEDENISGIWRPVKGTPSDLIVSKKVKMKSGGWLDKYQDGAQVAANLPWINQQGQVTPFLADEPEPKSLEDNIDDILSNPQKKALMLNRGINNDNLRHSGASMHTTESLGSTLGAAILAQGLGAAHEISNLPKRIQNTKTDDVGYYDNIYHNVIESGEDIFNNAVGSMVGMIPFVPTRAKESLLVYLSNNNMMPDGKSMPEGNKYVPKKKYGGWLDKYQEGKQVPANLPWINQQGQYKDPNGVGPTVQKAAELKQEKLKQAVRNSPSMQLPSGAITPTMGPIEYALMAPVAGASAMRAAPIIGSALNAPVAGVSGATVGNALGALGATDAIVNRFPEVPGQVNRGEYMDAAANVATGALDLFGANMVSPLFKGAKAAKKLPGSPNSGNVVDELREELQKKGIVSSQKTLNLPGKEIISKAVEPYGYNVGQKIKDIKSFIKDSPNPLHMPQEKLDANYKQYVDDQHKWPKGMEILSKDEYIDAFWGTYKNQLASTRETLKNRYAKRFSDENAIGTKNRYATWDMYLGKGQKEHPMYDISNLTKSKDDIIYTIKEDYMDKPVAEQTLGRIIRDIEQSSDPAAKKIKDGHWKMLGQDNIFGTMGGFNWDIKKLPNGNYEAYANDVWDLQPFKGRDLPKSIRNLEVGKALGIGKPLNVKVGFEIDKDTKKILKTYGMAPGAVAGAAALQKEKYGGWLDTYQDGAEVNCEDGNCRETDEIQAIYDQAQRIPERVVDFERGVAEQLWTDPKTGKEKKFLTINSGNPNDDARNIWKQQGAPDYFPSPSCMYVAGLGWRCAPETKEYMSNFDPLPFNSNTGFINAVNKSGLPFKRAAETNDPYFDAQQKGKLRPGDVVNFKGPDVSHAMTFIGYDDKGRSDWFHSNGMPNMVALENNLWEDLRKPGVKKYVNRFDEDRYVKETYGDKIEQLEKQARENPTYYKKRGGITTDNQDYNYIKYKDLSLSKGMGWLDNYK
jgi:hypothetical protein